MIRSTQSEVAIRSEVAGASLSGVGEEGSVSSPERDRTTTVGLVAEEGSAINLKKVAQRSDQLGDICKS